MSSKEERSRGSYGRGGAPNGEHYSAGGSGYSGSSLCAEAGPNTIPSGSSSSSSHYGGSSSGSCYGNSTSSVGGPHYGSSYGGSGRGGGGGSSGGGSGGSGSSSRMMMMGPQSRGGSGGSSSRDYYSSSYREYYRERGLEPHHHPSSSSAGSYRDNAHGPQQQQQHYAAAPSGSYGGGGPQSAQSQQHYNVRGYRNYYYNERGGSSSSGRGGGDRRSRSRSGGGGAREAQHYYSQQQQQQRGIRSSGGSSSGSSGGGRERELQRQQTGEAAGEQQQQQPVNEEQEESAGRRKNRDISTSHERSRSRERRRRRAQAECIRRAGGFQKLADSEGHEPIRLFWDGFQWVAKTGGAPGTQGVGADAATMNSTRKLRRLYFGNLPLHLGLTESAFQEIVWTEMKTRGFCNSPETNPVLYVWFAKDKGNYGFVEFSTVEETERALTMDGMLCLGIPLKVSRPNDYSTTSSAQTQAMSVMGQQAAAMLIGQLAPIAGGAAGSSRFMRIIQIVDPSTLNDDEDYEDLLEDVKEGCEKAGKIVNGLVITPKNKGATPFEVCDILFEYATPQEVDACILSMTGRKYMGKPITMVRLEEALFTQHAAPLLKQS